MESPGPYITSFGETVRPGKGVGGALPLVPVMSAGARSRVG